LSLAVSRHEGWSTTTQRFSPDLEIDAARRRFDAPIGISRMNAGSD
jgi:hypothetical protein